MRKLGYRAERILHITMGKSKTSDTSASSDTSKKKDKQASSSKPCQNDMDGSDSDSEDMRPQVYPGTHWPLDATLELYINYDAVKEIRAVKPDFYPMLFYLTKSDYSSVARVVSKLPVIMDHLQARLDKGKGPTQTPADVKPAPTQPPKAVTPTIVRDLKTAKEEILKLVSNMCLTQKDAWELLDWVKTFGTKKKGRTGFQLCEQDIVEEHSKPVTRTQTKTEDSSVSSKMQTNSDSKSVSTRAQEKSDNKPVSTKNQVKSDPKSATISVKRLRKDAFPVDPKARPPTREEIYANINKMTAAQIMSRPNNVNNKQSLKDKMGTRKRGRPRKYFTDNSEEETDSASETASIKHKSKSRPSKSLSPAASLPSPSPPILSPQSTSSPSRINLKIGAIQNAPDGRFSLSLGVRQTASDAIKCILSNKKQQSSWVGEKDQNAGGEWPQPLSQPVPIPAPPFRNNFGPVPMCLYRVQADTDTPPMNNSMDLVTPKIEIDNAEEDHPYEGSYNIKVEPGSSSRVESSVSASGTTQKSSPIIKTICTGPVCGGDNCVHEHSVIVEDCDHPEMDCVMDTFVQDAKEAEPIIIIDDC